MRISLTGNGLNGLHGPSPSTGPGVCRGMTGQKGDSN